MVYIDNIDKLLFFEKGSDTLMLISPDSGELNKKSLKVVPDPLILETFNVKKNHKTNTIKIDKKEQ
jgi:hypothetical protein